MSAAGHPAAGRVERRTLVVAPQWVGDAVMSEPLVRSLVERGDRVSAAALPWVEPVYRAISGISDVIMTGITGIEAAIEIRNKAPKCKILLFSGQAATADLLEKARAQGHEFEILAKPVHPTDLLAKLRG